MQNEMPVMAAMSMSSTTTDMANLMSQMQHGGLAAQNQLHNQQYRAFVQPPAIPIPTYQENIMLNTNRRLVQVFIADPDENVPLESCLLYSGEQKLTDLTDQELFFEIDIRSILEKHNKDRVKLIDKSVKERVEKLEPARIRDLKMTVVTVANF